MTTITYLATTANKIYFYLTRSIILFFEVKIFDKSQMRMHVLNTDANYL